MCKAFCTRTQQRSDLFGHSKLFFFTTERKHRLWCVAKAIKNKVGLNDHAFDLSSHFRQRTISIGGFDQVNALYRTGELECEYLKGLTQTERCEMEVRARNGKGPSVPLFWFPHQVDGNVVRMSGVLTCFTALVAAALFLVYALGEKADGNISHWGVYLACGLFLDFCGRILAGSRASLSGTLATILVKQIFQWEANPRVGRPKQSAACFGWTFSLLGSIAGLVAILPCHHWVAAAVMLTLAVACGMEAFIVFCFGCFFFKLGIQLGLVPKYRKRKNDNHFPRFSSKSWIETA